MDLLSRVKWKITKKKKTTTKGIQLKLSRYIVIIIIIIINNYSLKLR